jgi:hypothetical protein
MSKKYKRQCKCCGVEFETNRSDKFYLNRSHQVRNNNVRQSNTRRKQSFVISPLLKTYRILNRILGQKKELTVSKDFLRGAGANIALMTNHNLVNDQEQAVLIDIALIPNRQYITLKRIQND